MDTTLDPHVDTTVLDNGLAVTTVALPHLHTAVCALFVKVGARFEIHHYLRGIAEQGTAILWVTTDVEEAVLVADRLVVLREGRIVAELTGASKTQGQAVAMAAKDAA